MNSTLDGVELTLCDDSLLFTCSWVWVIVCRSRVPKGVDHTLSLCTFELRRPHRSGNLREICLQSLASLNSVCVCVYVVYLMIVMLKTRQIEFARGHRVFFVLLNNSLINPTQEMARRGKHID